MPRRDYCGLLPFKLESSRAEVWPNDATGQTWGDIKRSLAGLEANHPLILLAFAPRVASSRGDCTPLLIARENHAESCNLSLEADSTAGSGRW